jgi:3-hydroxybutyryl-CoA dehydrogenase
MKIFARGEKIRTAELQNRFSSVLVNWTIDNDYTFDNGKLHEFDFIFDLNFDEQPTALQHYATLANKPVIVAASKQSLVEATQGIKCDCLLIGINALPTFLNRTLAEISLLQTHDAPQIANIFAQFEWDYKIVNDRVGMVTPRVVCMIINEACYTVQEGTATMHDIDISMKLGTNYPFGPFEWANKIGIKHVYELLDAVYNDTHDERYKICPLLKTHYLTSKPFLNT